MLSIIFNVKIHGNARTMPIIIKLLFDFHNA